MHLHEQRYCVECIAAQKPLRPNPRAISFSEKRGGQPFGVMIRVFKEKQTYFEGRLEIMMIP